MVVGVWSDRNDRRDSDVVKMVVLCGSKKFTTCTTDFSQKWATITYQSSVVVPGSNLAVLSQPEHAVT